MQRWKKVLDRFINQAQESNLKTATYPKDYAGLTMKVSFGQGAPARIPWIAFIAPDMAVSKGIYPVYLYYKDLNTLILAYGISETDEYGTSWPTDVMNSSQTITAYFDKDVPRYGDSFVFKAYTVATNNDEVEYKSPESGGIASEKDLESDLSTIIEYYKKLVTPGSAATVPEINQGLFYMEKQLEDFLIRNWENTELGQKYNLIKEDGELKSQQYRTEIGRIDILAKDKESSNYVVIELKKNQTSDDTVGQLTRYMGWVSDKHGDKDVKGIIICGQYDKRLEYATRMVPNTEVFVYEVDFKLIRAEK